MSKIEDVFRGLRIEKRCALIPYFMAFYPDCRTFGNFLFSAQESGADIIEVGIPFSDPIADGSAIQEAGSIALSNGATVGRIFDLLQSLQSRLSIPLVIMSYVNLILRYGVRKFFESSSSCGIAGVVVPDLPVEESEEFKSAANGCGLDMIQFVAPTTSESRLPTIVKFAQGFVYLVSLTGVTGARESHKFRINRYVKTVRRYTELPICVGFGIATPEQAAEVSRAADGVIVGSALVETVRRSKASAEREVGKFLR
ncbi:MAG: tryptophan synthase subunit alpha, partial [Planctomycetota bacterium]|nr:tryptophan synthase subunit alpha [Planctomycetota bacterium]